MTNPYESPELEASEVVRQPDPCGASDGRICSILACVVAAIALAFPIPSLLEMASYPPGTAMRPMGAVGAVVLSSLGGLFLAVPLAILGLLASRRLGRQIWFGYAALLIASLAVVGPPTILELIINIQGYVMKE